MTKIDHLVVGAANLSAGVEYVNGLLGVDMPYGGEHEKMGTHNHLMQLGSRLFLEVIAINPQALKPDRCRWYGLDDPEIQLEIKNQPRLLTWVVNTKDISALIRSKLFDFGKPELISRSHLSWYFGLPDDGRLFEGGTLPYIIQWNTNQHPAVKMANLKCKFKSLDIYHPDTEWLGEVLTSIGALELVNLYQTAKPAHFIANIETPQGLKQLSSLLAVDSS